MLKQQNVIIGHQLNIGQGLKEQMKHSLLKEEYFDLQAREMQGFLERFLGSGFNIQCNFSKKDGMYFLWIWKIYETRDMGVKIHALAMPGMIESFMDMYYKEGYFTDATAFPKE